MAATVGTPVAKIPATIPQNSGRVSVQEVAGTEGAGGEGGGGGGGMSAWESDGAAVEVRR